ncbi:NepR family anti-sigma factor [Rhizobium helianthi]|uniref:NepR family anti-sigma factor n=1 Tax=Rhizobium helianthi TaxID=1132695 RepID=A0ABW4M735_9HYPH
MSDDKPRKKDEMNTAQSSNLRPGATSPNASISRKLREFYDAVQEEGIPDRFMELLERLEEAEKKSKSVNPK